MAEFTSQKNLYKWNITDTKRTTINEMANNAQKIDEAFANVDEKVNGIPGQIESLEAELQNNSHLKEAVVSITDGRFGAKGDGTDESSKMQAAIDYIASKGGGKVIIPYGTFKGNITISTRNIHIDGAGTLKGTINLYGTDTIGVSRFDPIRGIGDISIRGITIDGEKTRNGIQLKWVFGITIEGVTFKHCLKSIYFHPIPNSQHCSRITINANRMWDSNYGLYVDYDPSITDLVKYEVGDITYTNNVHESRNSGWDGNFGNHYHIWAKGLDGLVCKGNTFFFSTIGVEVTNIYLELFNWVIIEGNQLFQAVEHGIKAVNGSNLIIANNNFAWTKKQAVWLSAITSGSVRGNNFSWNDDAVNLANRTGVYVEESGFFIGNISDNNFTFPNEYAIHLKNTSHVNINGNNSRNKYAAAEAVKIDSLSSCNDIVINGNLFTNYPVTLQSVIATKGSQQRIYFDGNGENNSGAVFEGVFLQKRTATINASQTALDSSVYDQFNFANGTAHTIGSVTGGFEGKEILFVGFNGNTTISATIGRLKGGVNATIPNFGTMKLKYTAGNWYEISRSF
jgi:Right handed beta helix region